MEKKIILASTSPRRKDILKKMGLEFKIVPSSYEEILENDDFEYEKIEVLAYHKALAVAKLIKNPALVIGADTVVVLENRILGKPKDEKDAKMMLKSLSGKIHFVVTSLCLIDTETKKEKISSVTSYVEFDNLSEIIINNYVETFKPLDKAGAYGIQELPEGFIKKIEGSRENIIGLCSNELAKMLKDFELVSMP